MATTTTPNYEINYDDERFSQVEFDKKATQAEYDNIYQERIDNADTIYQGKIDEIGRWSEEQQKLQQDRTDFTIEQIEQQKDKANKDYLKEQSGAYVDWQKQSNQYGVNAEKMASQGLTGTGFSESSQVSMYNTYQNRIAVARESFNQAVLNYDNAIKDAQLQNSSILAEIAHNAFMEQAELSIQAALYKDNLILEQANKKLEIDQMYHQRWQDVLNQMNTENALAENARQFNEGLVFEAEQNQLDREHAEKLKEIQHAYDKELAEIEQEYKLAYLTAQTKAEKERIEKEYEEKKKYLTAEREEQEKLLKYEQSLKQTAISSGSGSGGSSSSGSSGGSTTTNKTSGTTSSSEPTFDTASLIAAGYAAKSAQTIYNDYAAGKIFITTKGNKMYVTKNPAYFPSLSNYAPLSKMVTPITKTSYSGSGRDVKFGLTTEYK